MRRRAAVALTRIPCARIIYSMNLTISIDERVVEQAREVARRQGVSLNALVREFIEGLAGQRPGEELSRRLVALWGAQVGDSGGEKITREDAYVGRW